MDMNSFRLSAEQRLRRIAEVSYVNYPLVAEYF
jgi:hypothetical protein